MKILAVIALLLTTQLVQAQTKTFTLKSKDVGGQFTNKQFYNSFGYKGANISPQLSWENAPEGTKSFAVTIHDADAPTGSGWWHWVIFNIPVNVSELKTDAGNIKAGLAPAGSIQSRTDFGTPGYGGPCPPPGAAHPYIITVYALKDNLKLDQTAMPAYVGYNLSGSTLAKASLLVYGSPE